MRLLRSDAEPELYLEEVWASLLPARPIEGCPGAWELKGPPGERGRWSLFGVSPGESLARADVLLLVTVRRHDERALPGTPGPLILRYPTRSGRCWPRPCEQ